MLKALYKYTLHTCNGHVLWTIPTGANSLWWRVSNWSSPTPPWSDDQRTAHCAHTSLSFRCWTFFSLSLRFFVLLCMQTTPKLHWKTAWSRIEMRLNGMQPFLISATVFIHLFFHHKLCQLTLLFSSYLLLLCVNYQPVTGPLAVSPLLSLVRERFPGHHRCSTPFSSWAFVPLTCSDLALISSWFRFISPCVSCCLSSVESAVGCLACVRWSSAATQTYTGPKSDC